MQVRHTGATPNAVPWSSMEEQLLCAVVHEFGPNFAFAADVLAACSQLQGIFRRASQCKEKFKQLTVGLALLPACLPAWLLWVQPLQERVDSAPKASILSGSCNKRVQHRLQLGCAWTFVLCWTRICVL